MLFIELIAKAIGDDEGSLLVCFAGLCVIAAIYMLVACFSGARAYRTVLRGYCVVMPMAAGFWLGTVIFDNAIGAAAFYFVGTLLGGVTLYLMRSLPNKLLRTILSAGAAFSLGRILASFAFDLPLQLVFGVVCAIVAVVAARLKKPVGALSCAGSTALFGGVCAARIITSVPAAGFLYNQWWPYVALCIAGIIVQVILLIVKREKISQAFDRR